MILFRDLKISLFRLTYLGFLNRNPQSPDFDILRFTGVCIIILKVKNIYTFFSKPRVHHN